MITIVGTGHIFKIAEPISFIIKNIWPEAVLVELDEARYQALIAPKVEHSHNDTSAPWVYRKIAEYQSDMAEEYGSDAGSDLISAVETGRIIGSRIEFIDTDASQTMDQIWKEMRFIEKFRFTGSMFKDRFTKRKGTEDSLADFVENEDRYIAEMRKKYPTLVRKLIDERNSYMASKIIQASKEYGEIVVVVGDAHVEGISRLLPDREIRKIRLRTLMNKNEMDTVRSELWTGIDHKDEMI